MAWPRAWITGTLLPIVMIDLCASRALPARLPRLPVGLARRWSKSTTVQGGVLFGTADTIAQTLQSEPFELRRVTSFAAFGAFYVCYVVYKFQNVVLS